MTDEEGKVTYEVAIEVGEKDIEVAVTPKGKIKEAVEEEDEKGGKGEKKEKKTDKDDDDNEKGEKKEKPRKDKD